MAVLGIAFTFGLAGLNSSFKRQRLGSAAEEVKTIAGRALTEMQDRNAMTFLAFGKYVAGQGTDVVVVVDANGNRLLDEAIDPNSDGLFDDGPRNLVLWRTRLAAEIALSNTDPTAQTFNSNWFRPASGPVSAYLVCDFVGRATLPGIGAPMITGPATVQLAHAEMITGKLKPMVTYTVSVGPLFKSSLTRVTTGE